MISELIRLMHTPEAQGLKSAGLMFLGYVALTLLTNALKGESK